jgi:hypothetical protein
MNDVLRNYIASSEEALETTLRRVLREELDRPKPARSPHAPRQKKAAAK